MHGGAAVCKQASLRLFEEAKTKLSKTGLLTRHGCTAVIPACRRLRKEDFYKFKASQDHTVRPGFKNKTRSQVCLPEYLFTPFHFSRPQKTT